LARERLEHPFLDTAPSDADFQQLLLDVSREKKEVDEKNKVTLGLSPTPNELVNANLASLPRDRYFLWKDSMDLPESCSSRRRTSTSTSLACGRTMPLLCKRKPMRQRRPRRRSILCVRAEGQGTSHKDARPRSWRLRNPGEDAPPEFLAILTDGPQKPFTKAPRLELAESITTPKTPSPRA